MISDPIEALLGEICVVTIKRRIFSAKLIAVCNGDEIWFESKAGNHSMVRRNDISSISILARKASEAV